MNDNEDTNDQAGALPPSSSDPVKPTVVGIGASAGGLTALKRLFEMMPSDTGLAFVVVVHLSPEHKSHLADILQSSVRFPVQQVNDTTPLEANNVYVIPPNANLSAIDTHLRLSKLEAARGERAPIDHFFRTLASAYDGHSIGVILTGTGSDGTLGLKDIKAKGGLILVQDPNEAEYDGMPQSAIATGLVDRILSLDEMPEALARLAQIEPLVLLPEDEEDRTERNRVLLAKVLSVLKTRTERDFSRYKAATLLRRIARRMQLNYIEDVDEYIEKLRTHPEETRSLADDLLVTVTSFFRDPEVFTHLEKQVIPQMFEGRGPASTIRLWSVGCATGEEAYSLAILLLEEAARRESRPKLQIFASDLHKHSLEEARIGLYSGDIATDIGTERLKRFFRKENGGYRINKEVREIVTFAPHNLLADPPFSRLDLITCRNLLIYLDRAAQKDVVDLFHYALCPNGYLLLGSAETIDASDLFRTQDKKLCLYTKRNVPPPEPRLPVFPVSRLPRNKPDSKTENISGPVSYDAVHQSLLERYAPPSILIAPDNRLAHLSESAGRYLVLPGGDATLNAVKVVRDELRLELHKLLQLSRDTKQLIDSKPIPVRLNGHTAPVVMHVRPAHDADQEGYLLVIFEEHQALTVSSASSASIAAADLEPEQAANRVVELESELAEARQRLQANIEEYETSREEMKASAEEMQSTNEELRATMEELETSKEELQSINEELQTINQENRHKVEELSQLTSDLHNFMAATDIASLFLDRDLRILRFTPQLAELFNVRVSDRGRPISDLTHRLGYRQLRDDAEAVLSRLIPIEREIRDDRGQWYLTRVLPYRSTEDHIQGVVITLIDITAQKTAEAALKESEGRLRLIVESAHDYAIFTMDAEGIVLDWYPGAAVVFGYAAEEIQGRHVDVLYTPEDRAAGVVVKELEQAQAEGSAPDVRWHVCQNGERVFIEGHTTALRDAGGRLTGFLKIGQDVTDRRQAEEALQASRKLLARELEDAKQLQRISSVLVEDGNGEGLYEVILDASMAILGADCGSLQLLEPDGGKLRLLVSRNFHPESAAFWKEVSVTNGTSCGSALQCGERMIVPDVQHSKIIGQNDLEQYIKSGIMAVQSTPLVTRHGKIIGMVSTHWCEVHTPDERELRLLDVVARQAADFFERRHAQEALRDSDERFRLLVENVQEYALFQADKDGVVTSWNPGAERLFGYTSAEMLGRDMSCLLPVEERDSGVLQREIEQVLSGNSQQHARWLMRQDGSQFWAQWVTEPVRDERGEVRGVAKVLRDETERQRGEEVIRASLIEKEELLKEVHHRVKNNLQVITSLINLQGRQVEDERVLALFDETRNRVYSIAAIHELIYRSASFAEIDMTEYARQLVPNLLRFYGAEQRIGVSIEGDGTTLELERAVPFGLLLNELASNVCKHAFPQEATGDLRIRIASEDSHATLEVADTGVGLPAGFDYRRSGSLGLELVHSLARQLRATIDVMPGPGTRVIVRLPQGKANERP